jgi:hypothetical protein
VWSFGDECVSIKKLLRVITYTRVFSLGDVMFGVVMFGIFLATPTVQVEQICSNLPQM